MGSSLVIPKVGTLIKIRADDVNTVNKSYQIRITHDTETDAWFQSLKEDPGFIVWVNDYQLGHNTVRINAIAKTGTFAWGNSLFIQNG